MMQRSFSMQPPRRPASLMTLRGAAAHHHRSGFVTA
jgi:hypothetical protein